MSGSETAHATTDSAHTATAKVDGEHVPAFTRLLEQFLVLWSIAVSSHHHRIVASRRSALHAESRALVWRRQHKGDLLGVGDHPKASRWPLRVTEPRRSRQARLGGGLSIIIVVTIVFSRRNGGGWTCWSNGLRARGRRWRSCGLRGRGRRARVALLFERALSERNGRRQNEPCQDTRQRHHAHWHTRIIRQMGGSRQASRAAQAWSRAQIPGVSLGVESLPHRVPSPNFQHVGGLVQSRGALRILIDLGLAPQWPA